MTSSPAAPAVTDLTNTDLANFAAILREQRSFRLQQLAELSVRGESDGAGLEVTDVLERAARHALAEIDLALDRVRCGRYGRCVDCGQAVGRDRLEVLPSAARCMPCQHRIGNGRPSPRRRALPRREMTSAK